MAQDALTQAKRGATQYATQSAAFRLPPLYTEGQYVKRRDTGEPVQLKGVTSNAFRYQWPGDPESALWGRMQVLPYRSGEDVIRNLQQAKDWGANYINFYIQPESIERKLPELDKVVGWANTNGMYVSLIPADLEYSVMDKRLERSLSNLAQRYKNQPNVIYGLWAEPGQINGKFDNKTWLPRAEQLAQAVRNQNPDSMIVMAGQNYARDLGPLQEKPFPFQNVIYDFHDYPYGEEETDPSMKLPESQRYQEPGSSNYQWMVGKYPVMMGEFGRYSTEDFGSPTDLGYIQRVVGEANRQKLHTLGYALDEMTPGLSLMNPQGATLSGLSPKGQIFQQDFAVNPPTRFLPPPSLQRSPQQATPAATPSTAQRLISLAANSFNPISSKLRSAGKDAFQQARKGLSSLKFNL